jgi:hypothetical protein
VSLEAPLIDIASKILRTGRALGADLQKNKEKGGSETWNSLEIAFIIGKRHQSRFDSKAAYTIKNPIN